MTITLLSTAFSSFSDDFENDRVTFIFASEMPDISDPVIGRYPELKYLIDQQRNANPLTFFIFGGGSIGPSALANLDRGSHIIDLLNSLEPDAMGIAKREYSFFEDELSLRAHEAAFPIISSNTIDKRINKVSDGLVSHALIQKEDVSVGVISIIHSRTIHEYLLKHLDVLPPQETVRKQARLLRTMGADFVVLHHFYSFDFVPLLIEEGIIDLSFVSNTRYARQNQSAYKMVERIVGVDKPGEVVLVHMHKNGDKLLNEVKLINLENTAVDSDVKDQLDEYQLRLERLLNINIGYWDGEFTTRLNSLRTGENAFANYVADVMRDFAKTDVVILNGGSIRGNKDYKNNEVITRQTIASEMPYRSTMSVLSITGKDMLEALENGFAGIDELKGSFVHVSGMSVKFDSSAPAGNRVKSVVIAGSNLQLEKQYRLATSDYLANGGDGFESLTRAQVLSEKRVAGTILISDLIVRDIELKGKLTSQIDGRLIDIVSKQ
jgi:2',3'-cyclic-nucleotide 2'-phosphodiesterase (5'-nucleotidase family)